MDEGDEGDVVDQQLLCLLVERNAPGRIGFETGLVELSVELRVGVASIVVG
jgi:hypothetical protein